MIIMEKKTKMKKTEKQKREEKSDKELVSQLIIRNRLGEADRYIRASRAEKKGLRIAFKQTFDI